MMFRTSGFSLLLCFFLREVFEISAFFHILSDKRVKVRKKKILFLIHNNPISTLHLLFSPIPPLLSVSLNSVLCFSPSQLSVRQEQLCHYHLHLLAVTRQSIILSRQTHCFYPCPAVWAVVYYMFISMCVCMYIYIRIGYRHKECKVVLIRHYSESKKCVKFPKVTDCVCVSMQGRVFIICNLFQSLGSDIYLSCCLLSCLRFFISKPTLVTKEQLLCSFSHFLDVAAFT